MTNQTKRDRFTSEQIEAVSEALYEANFAGASISKVWAQYLAKVALDAVAALEVAADQHVVGGWLPIETAPYDTEVLVWDGRLRNVAVKTKSKWGEYWSVPLCEAEAVIGGVIPEAWQPLPAPPSADNMKTEEE